MLMPLYFPSREAPRVVIIGGGYAGLSALVTLRERRPDAEITLIDPRPDHLKITHLHETFRHPLKDYTVPFARLAQRFDFRHIQAELAIDDATLSQWAADRAVEVHGDWVEFDYLLCATGAGFRRLEPSPDCLGLEDFTRTAGPELLQPWLEGGDGAEKVISVVGSGATGIQFLFEIEHYLRVSGQPCRLRLVDSGEMPLQQFNAKLGRYVEARMQDRGIEYLPNRYFRNQLDGLIEVEDTETGERSTYPSVLSLLFIGMQADQRIHTNVFGQVQVGGKTLGRVFAAGDGSRFAVPGSNSLSAQSALRKGRLVARNILRHSSVFKLLEPYLHRDLGYVIGMGPTDAVGWVALEGNIIGGQPAAVLKDIVEAQYDLLMAGMDTYVL